jgi:glycosyltransferase
LKVSIITATYNSAATVLDTLQSVQSQTWQQLEHIVVDGASTDDTLRLLEIGKHRGPFVSEPDKGIYDAMNKGIQLASGEIIGILNSDDVYADRTIIEKVVKLFEETGADAVYGDLWYVDAGDMNNVKRKWVAGSYRREGFLYGWMPPHPTFFVRKSVYQRYGLFNLNMYTAADYELMLRFLYKYQIPAAYLPEVMVKMRVGGASNQSLKNRLLANKGDRLAWRVNGLKPYWFTVTLKPIRKITQFIT